MAESLRFAITEGDKVIDFNFRNRKNSIRRLVAVYNDADAALSQGWGGSFCINKHCFIFIFVAAMLSSLSLSYV